MDFGHWLVSNHVLLVWIRCEYIILSKWNRKVIPCIFHGYWFTCPIFMEMAYVLEHRQAQTQTEETRGLLSSYFRSTPPAAVIDESMISVMGKPRWVVHHPFSIAEKGWNWLVVIIPTPLKNMSSSIGMSIPNIWKNKNMLKPPTKKTGSRREHSPPRNRHTVHPEAAIGWIHVVIRQWVIIMSKFK